MYWPVAVLLGIAAAVLAAMACPVASVLAKSSGSPFYIVGYFALLVGDIGLLVFVVARAL